MARLVVASLAVILFGLLPWVSAVVALVGWRATAVGDAALWVWSLGLWCTTVLILQLIMWRLYPVLKISHSWSLTYVGGVVIALGMLINAMLKVMGATGTTWRGTHYRGHVLEAAAPVKNPPMSDAPAPPAKPVPAEEMVADG